MPCMSIEYAEMPVHHCYFCGEQRRFLIEVRASGYIVDCTCLGCGTLWLDGEAERPPRFNDLQWREKKIAKAKERIAAYRKAGCLGRKAANAAIKRWMVGDTTGAQEDV